MSMIPLNEHLLQDWPEEKHSYWSGGVFLCFFDCSLVPERSEEHR